MGATMGNKHTTRSGHKQAHGPAWKRLHRDWKAWVVVGLMLAAMGMYVLSDDESLPPDGGPPNAPVPAATGI